MITLCGTTYKHDQHVYKLSGLPSWAKVCDGQPLKIQQILAQNGYVEFEGVTLKMLPGPLAPGDTFVAERNSGPKLLTVHHIDIGAVFPVEIGYDFDTWECVKVEMVGV